MHCLDAIVFTHTHTYIHHWKNKHKWVQEPSKRINVSKSQSWIFSRLQYFPYIVNVRKVKNVLKMLNVKEVTITEKNWRRISNRLVKRTMSKITHTFVAALYTFWDSFFIQSQHGKHLQNRFHIIFLIFWMEVFFFMNYGK